MKKAPGSRIIFDDVDEDRHLLQIIGARYQVQNSTETLEGLYKAVKGMWRKHSKVHKRGEKRLSELNIHLLISKKYKNCFFGKYYVLLE